MAHNESKKYDSAWEKKTDDKNRKSNGTKPAPHLSSVQHD